MFHNLSSLAKQIAYCVVFVLVVFVFILAVQANASKDKKELARGSQEVMANLIMGTRFYPNLTSAENIINKRAYDLRESGNTQLADQLLKTARNHAMLLEKTKRGEAITVWLERSQNGYFYRYTNNGKLTTQICNGGPECSAQGLWFLPADLCLKTIKVYCSPLLPSNVTPEQISNQ